MTIIVIFAVVVVVTGSAIMWKTKRWEFERAFFFMLLAVMGLALYTYQKVNADNLRENAYKACLRGNHQREAVQQFARDNPDLNGVDALALAFIPVSCESIYHHDPPRHGE